VNKPHLKNQSPEFLFNFLDLVTLQAFAFVADPWLGGTATVVTRMLAENSENQRKTGENIEHVPRFFWEFLLMECQRNWISQYESKDFDRWKGYSPLKSKSKSPTQP
jgi:hypothetical protein